MPPKKSSKRKADDSGSKAAAKRKAVAKARPADSVSKSGEIAAAALAAKLSETGWRKALDAEFVKPYFAEIAEFVAAERKKFAVHPEIDKVFEAFNVTPFDDVKVVLLGQDPYHEPGQAHGLCFSVLPGIKPPPSLKNMYKELEVDIPGFKAPEHGHLLDWAKQGVLMLNATLTVREGHKEANSHAKCGWQKFTDEAIRALNAREKGCVFLLWGGFAQKKGKLVDTAKHKVIESAHPSPLSVTKWRGCKTFSKCNAALKELGHAELDWSLK
jgi:uracil-DNA glycosylase